MRKESIDNEPISKKIKSQLTPNTSSSNSNLKRLHSLHTLKENYQIKKNCIQTALSNIDNNSTNKIIFDNTDEINIKKNISDKEERKKSLFDDESGDEFVADFKVKEQFQGKKGQKLLALQSKYKNDKRFILDSRFVEDHEEIVKDDSNEGDSFEMEKQKEYEILQQVLGKNFSKPSKLNDQESVKNTMLRFDPSLPEHSKFELQNKVEKEKKLKRKRKELISDTKKQEEKETPTVSKETFYKVTDNLKDSLHETQEFSLLNMFGRKEEEKSKQQNLEEILTPTVSNNFVKDNNPFKYDSSDEEDETQAILNKNLVKDTLDYNKPDELENNRKTSWSESFFFKHDDYRLQEGFDFIEKLKIDDNTDFSKLRRNLKEIVKAKVRNNQRKHKLFKKKLGGNKKKKMLRIKKALKR